MCILLPNGLWPFRFVVGLVADLLHQAATVRICVPHAWPVISCPRLTRCLSIPAPVDSSLRLAQNDHHWTVAAWLSSKPRPASRRRRSSQDNGMRITPKALARLAAVPLSHAAQDDGQIVELMGKSDGEVGSRQRDEVVIAGGLILQLVVWFASSRSGKHQVPLQASWPGLPANAHNTVAPAVPRVHHRALQYHLMHFRFTRQFSKSIFNRPSTPYVLELTSVGIVSLPMTHPLETGPSACP